LGLSKHSLSDMGENEEEGEAKIGGRRKEGGIRMWGVVVDLSSDSHATMRGGRRKRERKGESGGLQEGALRGLVPLKSWRDLGKREGGGKGGGREGNVRKERGESVWLGLMPPSYQGEGGKKKREGKREEG